MAIKREGVFTYHITQDREKKNLAILELIRKKSPISRAEISRTLGLNIVTVSNYIDFYINKRMILELGLDVSSGGRRPELLELNARSAYVVGVDIGPDRIIAAVADLKVNVVSKVKAPRPDVPMEDLAADIIKIIRESIEKNKIDPAKIRNIGVGMSGIVDYSSGTIHDTDPSRGRTKTSFLKFRKIIEDDFGVPVCVGNDASCAVFGEKILNPGADVDNLLYLYSDIGCGIVVQGEVYSGAGGCAGEIQLVFEHLQENEKNAPKEFTYLRPRGIDLGVVAAAQRAVAAGTATEIKAIAGGKTEKITRETVIEAGKKKDKVALELLQAAGESLGVRVALMVNLFNPDVLVIGGGMERAGELIFNSLKATVRKYAFEEPLGVVKIMPSLLGEDAVVLGAAALAAREVLMQV